MGDKVYRYLTGWVAVFLLMYCWAEYVDPLTGERQRSYAPALTIHFKGDVTGDDRVDLFDALIILRWVLSGSYPDVQREAADLNSNGKVDVGDAVICMRIARRM